MRHERTILISAMAAALALAGAVVGGCDMSTASQSMSMGWVPRAEHDRALAEAKKQREEADRQRAEAQKWQAQAQQERQAGEAARTAKGAGPQQATEDLITRVQDQAQRLQGLQADLARVEQ
ncbi:MAG: hypothetical protein NTV86_12335 [Planctomycetota bacterium]|nr:hypothetical protein [Planctomycetota bacterium]